MEDSGLNYWLKWQVPVCALVIILPTIIASYLLSKVQKPNLNTSDLWIPCWKSLSPIWLLIYRALVFSFMIWLLCLVASHEGKYVFYFYTQWTFALVIFYFGLGTVISANGCWEYLKAPAKRNEERDEFLRTNPLGDQSTTTLSSIENKYGETNTLTRYSEEEEAKKRAGFWGSLMQIIYQICAGAVMLTDIVFWCLLVPFQVGDNFRITKIIGGMHSLNLVFLVLDTALNRLPFPWFRMVYFVFWSATYIAFQWIIHLCGVSWWPYPFLELSTPWAPMWYLGVALVHIPCYAFYVLITKSKDQVFSKMFPRAYLRSSS
ncbi:hypothetical protein ACHQM5_026116 [Ranunculus cassubicifolius]